MTKSSHLRRSRVLSAPAGVHLRSVIREDAHHATQLRSVIIWTLLLSLAIWAAVIALIG